MAVFSYQCPNCHGADLAVEVSVTCHLQQSADGNMETEVCGDHDWHDRSLMMCLECGCGGEAHYFDTDARDNPDTTERLSLFARSVLELLSGTAEWNGAVADSIAAEAIKLEIATKCKDGYFCGRTDSAIRAHADLMAVEFDDSE